MEVTILVMHAQDDKKSLKEIEKQFRQLTYGTYRGEVQFRIVSATPGRELADEIQRAFLTLALLSPDFIGSPWIQALQKAAQLAKQCGSRVVPIHLRQMAWPFDWTLVWVPRDKAIDQYTKKDQAWNIVIKEIKPIIDRLLQEGRT